MIFEIKKINIKDKNYPELLKTIANPPETLYIKGELKKEESCFAVVGTRRPSSYGKQIALEIAGNLADAGLTIVSGLAKGVDTFSHQITVERKRRTIAVLGTGLDEKSFYPKENLKLAEKILENNGALISEYPPGAPGFKQNFPRRNRIISGLSSGVLVIEAQEKSGALITASYASSQKRKIFAVPGSVYSSNSKGCHYLIKKGAKLVENANDILKELKKFSAITDKLQIIKSDNEEERLILESLKKEALYVDKIIEKTKLKPSTAASVLAILEIEGRVRNLGGNLYALNR